MKQRFRIEMEEIKIKNNKQQNPDLINDICQKSAVRGK